jgi:hypothetical protein
MSEERRRGSSTGWYVGIIVALALLAIAYLVFSANSQPKRTAMISPVDLMEPAAA